jgi:hypothetical protein
MKSKEFIIMTIASLLLLGFVVYMFNYSFKMTKTGLIRQDLQNDSVLMIQNNQLKSSDSLLNVNDDQLNIKLDNHETRLRKLETRKPIVRKDTVFLVGEQIGE